MPVLIIAVVVLLAIWIGITASIARKNRRLIERLTERIYALESQSRNPAPQPVPIRIETALRPEPLPLVPRADLASSVEPAIPAPHKPVSFEETLGTNWLNKLGIVILVIGIAFFLVYELSELGPVGKVLVGYAVSAAMLCLGAWFDRREQWRVLARASLAGGWALVYFTTYAMHHVPAARILSPEGLDLILLLVAAAGMVAHTLRYNSQVITALAFLLAFTTINISRGNAYSLIAGAILAAGLAAVALRRRWFEAELMGIIAVYLNHYLWLRPIVESMQPRFAFPGYLISSILLFAYWLIFRISYVSRTVPNGDAERLSTAAALLNTGLLLWVLSYQSIHPELGFQLLAFMGATELAFGQLPVTRRRRQAFIVLNSLGTCLLFLAIPQRYSGHDLFAVWLAEAEALIVAGIFLDEILYYRLGVIAGLFVALATVFDEFVSQPHALQPGYAGLFAVAALLFYADSQCFPRRWPRMVKGQFDRNAAVALAHAAGFLALVALWLACAGVWTAVAWSVLAVTLAAIGGRFQSRELALQASVCAVAVAARAFVVNLSDVTAYATISWVTPRRLTMLLVIPLLYCAARFAGTRLGRRVPYFSALFLLTAFIAVELPSGLVTLGWGIEALAVFVFALWAKDKVYRFSALGLLCLCVLKIVFRDVWGLAARDRYLTFMVLGLALLAVSYLYTRFRDVLRQYF
ncbi:MAG: DUF2339 domain-containing protein [Acidobacteriaceae bacterium]|nr:DUF2339 domain-containing protein [Acidobacteriaceae bacterium]